MATLAACAKVGPPRPDCMAQDPVISVDTSHLSTPLIIPVQLIEDKMNRAINQELIKDESFDNPSKKTGKKDRLKVKVSRLGNIDVKWNNQVATYGAPLQVLLEKEIVGKNVLPSNKSLALKTEFSLRLVFETTIEIGPDWRLQPKTRFKNFEWLSEVRAFGGLINLKKIIEKRLLNQMPDIETNMDTEIREKVRLDRTVGRIWQKIQKPIAINRKHGGLLWLKIKPLQFEIGRIYTEGTNLNIQCRILAFTETLVGENPAYTIDSILPPLKKRAELPNDAYIYMLSEISYQELNEILNQKIAGQKIKVEGHNIRIQNVEVWGCGEDMVLHLDIRGSVSGDVYLQGKPEYAPDSQQLHIRNFDFTMSTQEALLSSAAWLMHSTFKEKIEQSLHLPLNEKIDSIPASILRGIEKGRLGDKIDMQIEHWTFLPQQIWMRTNDIAILIIVRAQVRVELQEI